MLKSLPDACLCLSSCLVVLVNSLLEVVKVLEAEKEKGRWHQVRINVPPEVEVRAEVRAAQRGARMSEIPTVTPLQASKSYICFDWHVSEPLARLHSQ